MDRETETPGSSANSWHRSDWSSVFPFRNKLVEYYTRFANHFNLDKCTLFGQDVQSACWDEARNLWVVTSKDITTDRATTWTTATLVQAVGTYNRKKYPDLPGMSSYTGEAWHTADWPADCNVGTLMGGRLTWLGHCPLNSR